MARAHRLGDTQFLIASEWWQRVVVQGQSEGEDGQDARIRNESLVNTAASTDERCVLKPGLVEGRDYRVVRGDVWHAFAFEFGYDWEVPCVVSTASKTRTSDSRSNTPVLDVFPANSEAASQEHAGDSDSGSSSLEDKASGDANELDRWRATLEQGQLVDVLDTDMKWYKARVVVVDGVRVKVCYVGWSPNKEEWLARSSPRLMPLYSNVERWREFQVNDNVQMGMTSLNAGAEVLEWREGRIIGTVGSLRVQISVDGDICWMDAQDELLCPPGTHRAENASSN